MSAQEASQLLTAHPPIWQSNLTMMAVLVATPILLIFFSFSRSISRPKPPGPPGWPIIGNALDLGPQKWLTFAKWGETYGDIIYLTIPILNVNIVVLNSLQVATDLLDRRAHIYSDRPNWVMASKMLTGGYFLPLAPYGDRWRKMHRIAHECLRRTNVNAVTVLDAQECAALDLALRALAKPEKWSLHAREVISTVLFEHTYGLPGRTESARGFMDDVYKFMRRTISSASPGQWAVDVMPCLALLPEWYAPWKAWAAHHYRHDDAEFMNIAQLSSHNERTCAVTAASPPIVTSELKGNAAHIMSTLSAREAAWLSASMYAAGSETTAITLVWWQVAMALHPQAQARAHMELDAVIGRTRTPKLTDIEHLPYTRALVREALRWSPGGPIAIPHRTLEEDEYQGYHIPKGAIVIPNVWSLNRDPAVFGQDTHTFAPERYLESAGSQSRLHKGTHGEGHSVYGFGRRICVGRHWANNALFIAAATCLWAMSFETVEGKEPDPNNVVEEGNIVSPAPGYAISIEARFPEAQGILNLERERREEEGCSL